MAFRLASSRLIHNVSKRNVVFTSSSTFLKGAYISQPCVITTRYNATLSTENKVVAPPMVYIAGEEMTHYAMDLIVDKWVKPYFDTSNWEYFDLSCKSRDVTNDQVLKDAVEAGKKIGAIFKEPTITPTAVQVRDYILVFETITLKGKYCF